MNHFELSGVIEEIEVKYYGTEGWSFDILHIMADGESVPVACFGSHPSQGETYTVTGKLSNNKGFLNLKPDKTEKSETRRRPPHPEGNNGPAQASRFETKKALADARARGAASDPEDDDLPF